MYFNHATQSIFDGKSLISNDRSPRWAKHTAKTISTSMDAWGHI